MGTLSHDPAADAGTPAEDVPTSVYRYYDAHDLLIYVGITNRSDQRNREHNDSKTWWPFVVRQEVEHFPNRLLAAARERDLIRSFHPPFNTQHNPGAIEMRSAYLAFASTPQKIVHPSQLVKQLRKKIPLEYREIAGEPLLFTSPAHANLVPLLTWPEVLRIKNTKNRVTEVKAQGALARFKLALPLPAHTFPFLQVQWENSKLKELRILQVCIDYATNLSADLPVDRSPSGLPCSWGKSYTKRDVPCPRGAIAVLVSSCPRCRQDKTEITCRIHAQRWSKAQTRCPDCEVLVEKQRPIPLPANALVSEPVRGAASDGRTE